jgi:hypothetical protein
MEATPVRRRDIIVGFSGLFSALVLGCESTYGHIATPAADLIPEVAAPYGLSGIELPDSREEISAVFDRLPRSVQGLQRNPITKTEGDRLRVTYGPQNRVMGAPLVLQAIDFREGDFFPADFTAGSFVAVAAGTDDYAATSFGRDRDLVWIQAETFAATAGDDPSTPRAIQPLHTLAWGAEEGAWLCTAAAATPEGLAALVSGFVAAARDEE